MFFAESVHSDHFFFIFLSVTLADGITVKKFIFDNIGIEPFFGVFLFFEWFFNHFHDNFLKVLRGDIFRGNHVSIVMVVGFWEHKKFIFDGETGLNKFDDIGEGIVDGNIEVTKPEEIGIFGDGNLTVVHSFDDFEYFILIFIALVLFKHILG